MTTKRGIFNKKYLNIIVAAFCILLGFGFSLHYAKAAGTFQLIGFSNSVKAAVGQPYSMTINYFYSGNNYSDLSLVGSHALIDDLKFSPVAYGSNGFDSVVLSGTPTVVGDYLLTLVLTDNYGALLSQPFDFNVVGDHILNITTNSIPDGTAGLNYSAAINLNWIGGNDPTFTFFGLPRGISQQYVSNRIASNNSGSETINLSGSPIAPGQFTITLSAVEGNIGTQQQFILNVHPGAITNVGLQGYANAWIVSFEYGGKQYNIPYTGTSVDINQVAADYVTNNLIAHPSTESVAALSPTSSTSGNIATPPLVVVRPTPSTTSTASAPSASSISVNIFTVNHNLMMGASGSDVINLQKFLEGRSFLTLPAGTTEGHFGNLTKQALIAFQKSVGLPTTGYCGPMTRSVINNSK